MTAPIILPDTLDGLRQRSSQADAMAVHAAYRTAHPFALVARQADFARRLDAIATQRGQE